MTDKVGTTKEASNILIYLMEELTDARLRAQQLKQYVAAALELVDNSKHKDHIYEEATDLLHGIPDTLFKLDKALDAAAMAAARMDYEETKQGLKPEKAEELERVLEDARLNYLKRRSSDMDLETRYGLVSAGAGEQFKKVNPDISDEDVEKINEEHEKNKDVVKDKHATNADFDMALEASKFSLAAAKQGNERKAALFGLHAFEAMAKGVAELAPKYSDKLMFLAERVATLRSMVVTDAARTDALEDSAQGVVGEEPQSAFMAARFAQAAANQGNERKAAMFGLHAIQMLAKSVAELAPKYSDKLLDLAERASRLRAQVVSEAARSDSFEAVPEGTLVMAGQDDGLEANLDDACWDGYEAYGLKPGAGGEMVPNCVPVKTAAGAETKKLKKYLDAYAVDYQRHIKSFFPGYKVLMSKERPRHGGKMAYSWNVLDAGNALRYGVRMEVLEAGAEFESIWTLWQHNPANPARPFMDDYHRVHDTFESYEKGLLEPPALNRALAELSRSLKGKTAATNDLVWLIRKTEGKVRDARFAMNDFVGSMGNILGEFQQAGVSPQLIALGEKNLAQARKVYRELGGINDDFWDKALSLASAKTARYEKGKPADPTENMSEEDAAEWQAMNEQHRDNFKSATEDIEADADLMARYEKGKPADPTENMTEEEAAEWEANTEKYKDKFKAAGWLDERDENRELEELTGGSNNAFRLMRLWEDAHRVKNWSPFEPPVNHVAVFIRNAFRERYSPEAIQHYVENIQGEVMPRNWRKLTKEAYGRSYGGRDPYWLTAKYPGKDKNGNPFKRGDQVWYYPDTKVILTGAEAVKAAREFGAMAQDEDTYNYRAAAMSAGKDLDLAFAFADAWGPKTVTDLTLRPAILEKVKKFAPHRLATANSNLKHLAAIWDDIAMDVRDLDFRSSKWMKPNEIAAVLKEICPSYNYFDAKKVGRLLMSPQAAGIMVQGAREGSPALYVKGPQVALEWLAEAAKDQGADDADITGDELRLWWD